VVLTSRRLLYIRSKNRRDSYELRSISQVSLTKRPFTGLVTCRVHGGAGGVKRFPVFPLEEAIAFHNALQSRIAKPLGSVAASEVRGHAAAVTKPGSSISLDLLGQLAELHAAGVITDTEFAAKKADILGRI
jgi:hypothetical protein